MSVALNGQTIFITGSGGVLGTAYVTEMLANGATVIGSDLPGARANAMKERFGTNPNFAYYDLDMGDEDAIVGIFQKIAADGLHPNVVLNNAAITGELLMGAGKS
ncbi:MAG: SDR family NAD(P)-dependent oxidoreductase, partial [Rhodobacteraceae bacterium]|nr:SDR family NAD(P)-dependent oxidoreductase [Paracoccaceae bacterium]